MMKKIIVVLVLAVCGSCYAGTSFGDVVEDDNSWMILASNEGITDLGGFANNYEEVESLALGSNQLTSIEQGDFEGHANLKWLGINDNQITSLESGDFDGLSGLLSLNIKNNQITSLEKGDFDGINSGLLRLDLSGNNLTSIENGFFDGFNDLGGLTLNDNPELSGEKILSLMDELDSLSILWLAGTFSHDWDWEIKNQLYDWHRMDGHHLYIPEPMSIVLLGIGGLVLRRRMG